MVAEPKMSLLLSTKGGRAGADDGTGIEHRVGTYHWGDMCATWLGGSGGTWLGSAARSSGEMLRRWAMLAKSPRLTSRKREKEVERQARLWPVVWKGAPEGGGNKIHDSYEDPSAHAGHPPPPPPPSSVPSVGVHVQEGEGAALVHMPGRQQAVEDPAEDLRQLRHVHARQVAVDDRGVCRRQRGGRHKRVQPVAAVRPAAVPVVRAATGVALDAGDAQAEAAVWIHMWVCAHDGRIGRSVGVRMQEQVQARDAGKDG